MSEVVHILFGAAFTVAVSWAIGRLLLERLVIRLYRLEQDLVAFVLGAAGLSFLTFLLCLAHQARKGVFQWTGAALVALAIWRLRRQPRAKSLPSVQRGWLLFFGVVFTAFFINYFFHALAPEVSPDGSGYHLGNVNRYWQAHGFVWTHHNMYSYLSQGLEMLFLVAWCFGRHSAAAMVHLAFQTALPLLLICFGLRTGYPRAAVFAAIVVYASPVVGMDGSIAYNDVGLSLILLAIVYLLEVWHEDIGDNLLLVIGVMCGFSYAVKYTSFTVVLLTIGYVSWHCYRFRRNIWKPLGLVLGGTALLAGPWILRNWIWLGNPAAPFLNRWFPNPYYHPGMEQIYAEGLRQYQDLQHWWQVPLELTIRGGAGVTGMLGPVFLLAPLALLAWRCRIGRLMLLAAVAFALPAFLNTGTRFLIPSLPFTAMAMGMAFQNSWGVLPALAVFQAVLSWPTVLSLYCHPYAWRLGSIPWEAALRRIPAADYIARHSGDYPLARTIELQVPPGGRIFSFAGRPESYMNREVLVSYESAEANLVNDILLAPIDGFKPTKRLRFAFAAQPLTAVRVVETASANPFWTVSEMRVFNGASELPRLPEWRLSARPNGWEVQLAFDNSPVTRWSSWEAMRPGQFIEARFARPETADAVVLEATGEGESHPRLEGEGRDGRWRVLSPAPAITETPPPRGMRRAATLEVKARGIGFLIANDSDFGGEDLLKYKAMWGVTELGEAGGARLYRID